MNEDEYNQQLATELPDPAKTIENIILPMTHLSVGFSNNPYLKLMKKDR